MSVPQQLLWHGTCLFFRNPGFVYLLICPAASAVFWARLVRGNHSNQARAQTHPTDAVRCGVAQLGSRLGDAWRGETLWLCADDLGRGADGPWESHRPLSLSGLTDQSATFPLPSLVFAPCPLTSPAEQGCNVQARKRIAGRGGGSLSLVAAPSQLC